MLTMTLTADLHAVSSQDALSVSDLFRRPILAASDGTETSLAALRISASLARRYDARVRVVTVIDPLLYPALSHGTEIGGAVGDADLLQSASTQRRAEVLEQIREVAGEAESLTRPEADRFRSQVHPADHAGFPHVQRVADPGAVVAHHRAGDAPLL